MFLLSNSIKPPPAPTRRRLRSRAARVAGLGRGTPRAGPVGQGLRPAQKIFRPASACKHQPSWSKGDQPWSMELGQDVCFLSILLGQRPKFSERLESSKPALPQALEGWAPRGLPGEPQACPTAWSEETRKASGLSPQVPQQTEGQEQEVLIHISCALGPSGLSQASHS